MSNFMSTYSGKRFCFGQRMSPEYVELEERVAAMIERSFGVDISHPKIKEADRKALFIEATHFFGELPSDWGMDDLKQTNLRLTPIPTMDADRAKTLFMEAYSVLCK